MIGHVFVGVIATMRVVEEGGVAVVEMMVGSGGCEATPGSRQPAMSRVMAPSKAIVMKGDWIFT